MRKVFVLAGFFLTTPILVIFSALFLLFLSYQQKHGGLLSFFAVQDKAIAYAALPSNTNTLSDSISEQDGRVSEVYTFLTSYNSPLSQYADLIVTTADKYGIDFRLLPAIGMQESGACLKEITGTHNCWGYGIYGKKVTSFDSYEQAIDTISRYFSKKKASGIDTLDELGAIYNPTNHNKWKENVASFMAEL